MRHRELSLLGVSITKTKKIVKKLDNSIVTWIGEEKGMKRGLGYWEL